MNKATTSNKQSLSLAACCATVFFSNACLMMIELAAGRMFAQDAGASLYTWTAVIGVILAGMTIGNYIGGRMADRFVNRQVIASLFAIASINCAATIVLSNRISGWSFLWPISWPVYILICVTILFFLPAVLLGAISPIAAKAALEGRKDKGRTIGSVFAFGAAGSIAGTFLAGFWLISAMGVLGVIWAIAAGLLASGLIYSSRYRPLQLWAVVLAALIFLGMGTGKPVRLAGALLTLRAQPDPNVIYQDETQYCQIRVKRESFVPDKRAFYQDRLKHSEIVMGDINNLQYHYVKVYATVTEQTIRDKQEPAFLAIGGGGFVFPRYLKHLWPAARVDVAEIDPGVIRAAMSAFGLPKNHGLNIFTMDGRNFVQELIDKKKSGQNIAQYDYVYGDTFDNFSVPYQLVTKEFNDKIAQILKDDGVYMLNLVDSYQNGLVAGSVLNTLEKTFKNVYILSPEYEYYNRTTFILIASRQALDINKLTAAIQKYERDVWCLNNSEIKSLRDRCKQMVLSDDYAPIDNLAAPIARQGGASMAAQAYIARAQNLSSLGQWDKPVALYMKAIEIFPSLTVKSYYDISEDLLMHREYQEAAFVCGNALKYYDNPGIKNDVSSINLNMGIAMKGLGRLEEAKKYFGRAIEGYKRRLQTDPNAQQDVLSNLGMSMAEMGRFSEATEYFRRAVEAAPSNSQYRFMLAEVLISQKDYAGARAAITEAIDAMKQAGNYNAVAGLQELLERVAYESSLPVQ